MTGAGVGTADDGAGMMTGDDGGYCLAVAWQGMMVE